MESKITWRTILHALSTTNSAANFMGRHDLHLPLLLLSLPLLPTLLPSLIGGTNPLLGLCKFQGCLFSLQVGIHFHWDIVSERYNGRGGVGDGVHI